MNTTLANKKLTKALWQFKRAEQKYIDAQVKARKLTEKAEKDYDKALKVYKQAQLDHLYSEGK